MKEVPDHPAVAWDNSHSLCRQRDGRKWMGCETLSTYGETPGKMARGRKMMEVRFFFSYSNFCFARWTFYWAKYDVILGYDDLYKYKYFDDGGAEPKLNMGEMEGVVERDGKNMEGRRWQKKVRFQTSPNIEGSILGNVRCHDLRWMCWLKRYRFI